MNRLLMKRFFNEGLFPLLRGLRGGVAAPIKQMQRYLKNIGAAGGVRPLPLRIASRKMKRSFPEFDLKNLRPTALVLTGLNALF